MLEYLSTKNFQAHTFFELALDPLVTCLCGPTDSGKSSLLRLLRWICLNEPSGDSFIKRGRPFAKGALKIDGYKIIRERGKGKNSYSLDKKVFTAFGQGVVPEEIAKLLNLGEVNFSSQLDGPFWFSLTPGQVSKELNKIVALDLIDRTLANLAKEVRQSKVREEVTRERLTQAKEKKQELVWVAEAEKELKYLEGLSNELEEKKSERDALSVALDALDNTERDCELHARSISVLGEAMELGGQLGQTIQERDELELALTELDKCQKVLETSLTGWTACQKGLDRASQERCPLCGREGAKRS